MLVRSGRASAQVDSPSAAWPVRELARTASAVVGNTTVQSGREQLRSATLELRVPSDRFDDVIAGLRGFGTVEAVEVTVSDVGEEYVDVAARVATARQLERRLIDLLATRTGKLAEVLQVENELARVRGEIERYEGRLRYLRDDPLSTLAITVHESVLDRLYPSNLTEATKHVAQPSPSSPPGHCVSRSSHPTRRDRRRGCSFGRRIGRQ
jgi:hypothetical protein